MRPRPYSNTFKCIQRCDKKVNETFNITRQLPWFSEWYFFCVSAWVWGLCASKRGGPLKPPLCHPSFSILFIRAAAYLWLPIRLVGRKVLWREAEGWGAPLGRGTGRAEGAAGEARKKRWQVPRWLVSSAGVPSEEVSLRAQRRRPAVAPSRRKGRKEGGFVQPRQLLRCSAGSHALTDERYTVPAKKCFACMGLTWMHWCSSRVWRSPVCELT